METPSEEPVTCACGRPLRDPVSIARRTGPRCWRKLHGPTTRRPRAKTPAATPGTGQPELPLDDQLALWPTTPATQEHQ